MYNKEMPMPKNPTKEQMEAGLKPWKEYLAPLNKKRRVESVAPVQWNGKTVTSSTSVENYKAGRLDVGGYMVVKAKNMAEAIAIAKKSPQAKTKIGPTIIREVVEVMQ
jgi:hypothetical protein